MSSSDISDSENVQAVAGFQFEPMKKNGNINNLGWKNYDDVSDEEELCMICEKQWTLILGVTAVNVQRWLRKRNVCVVRNLTQLSYMNWVVSVFPFSHHHKSTS